VADQELDFATHSNDAYFKAVFSKTERASAFFQEHLPPALREGLNWNSLALLPTSFVKQSLQQAHADLLYSVEAGGSKLLLYLLFEHQTTVDRAMPLRLLTYMVEIWLAHERENGMPLPVIVPFVLHQGPETWTVSTDFQDAFDIPVDFREGFLPWLPKFSHALLDLTQFDPAAQEHHAQLRVVLQLMKLARTKKLLEFFSWLAAEASPPLPPSLLRSSLMYALSTDVRLDVEAIYLTLESNPPLKEQTMSIAENLMARGKAEGKVEGKAEGKAEGEARGRLRLLQELMELPLTPPEELDRLTVEEMQRRFEVLQQEYELRFKAR
jgi:predicted transposase/invertase (TIGR01784 family)